MMLNFFLCVLRVTHGKHKMEREKREKSEKFCDSFILLCKLSSFYGSNFIAVNIVCVVNVE